MKSEINDNPEFESERYIDKDFTGASFKDSKFSDCIFENCNLSNVNLENTKLLDVIFKGCKISGLNFSRCNKFLMGFDFEESLISFCIFSNMDLRDTDFIRCKVNGCDFLRTNLNGADFEGSDLEKSIFENADLSFASFKNAKNYRIDPNHNILKKTKFSMPEAISLLGIFDIEIE